MIRGHREGESRVGFRLSALPERPRLQFEPIAEGPRTPLLLVFKPMPRIWRASTISQRLRVGRRVRMDADTLLPRFSPVWFL
jgi:hypothetical protein